jgi:hypothetical protein
MQAPLPLQLEAPVNWLVEEQVAAPQLVPLACCWQPLAPLQSPVFPQTAPVAHWPAGAVWPAGMAEQVPTPFRLQAWQVPQPFVVQQVPSTQKSVLPHWLPVVQAAPAPPFGVQVPPAQ